MVVLFCFIWFFLVYFIRTLAANHNTTTNFFNFLSEK